MAFKIPFYRHNLRHRDVRAVVKTLRSPWLTGGPTVAAFEEALSCYVANNKDASDFGVVAVNSATSGLFLVLKAFGVGIGDEVITTPVTFSATAAAILQTGARIVFCDVGDDLNIDAVEVAKKISSLTKAIIAVDYAGDLCHYTKLFQCVLEAKSSFCVNQKSEAKVYQQALGRPLLIADAAHSLGAYVQSTWQQQSGSLADATVFSFHAVKNITTGDGGAIVVRTKKNPSDNNNATPFINGDFLQEVRLLSQNASTKSGYQKYQDKHHQYDIVRLGYKCNLTDIAASLGLSQLSYYNRTLLLRQKLKAFYELLLKDKPWAMLRPTLTPCAVSACHLLSFHLQFNNNNNSVSSSTTTRDNLIHYLREHGIQANVHYKPMPTLTFYQKLGYTMKHLPNAQKLCATQISLPFYVNLKHKQAFQIVEHIDKFFHNLPKS